MLPCIVACGLQVHRVPTDVPDPFVAVHVPGHHHVRDGDAGFQYDVLLLAQIERDDTAGGDEEDNTLVHRARVICERKAHVLRGLHI